MIKIIVNDQFKTFFYLFAIFLYFIPIFNFPATQSSIGCEKGLRAEEWIESSQIWWRMADYCKTVYCKAAPMAELVQSVTQPTNLVTRFIRSNTPNLWATESNLSRGKRLRPIKYCEEWQNIIAVNHEAAPMAELVQCVTQPASLVTRFRRRRAVQNQLQSGL